MYREKKKSLALSYKISSYKIIGKSDKQILKGSVRSVVMTTVAEKHTLGKDFFQTDDGSTLDSQPPHPNLKVPTSH